MINNCRKDIKVGFIGVMLLCEEGGGWYREGVYTILTVQRPTAITVNTNVNQEIKIYLHCPFYPNQNGLTLKQLNLFIAGDVEM